MLYVGKISPHKAPHDLVKMLDVLRRLYDPAARLHLVGSPLGETYEPALRAFVSELGLGDAVNFAGSVTGAELEAYYRGADVFVSASDHEGFCVPLAEAMGHGLPIVAYGVTAVPETVAGAGLVLPDKSPAIFAAAVGRVLADPELTRCSLERGWRGRRSSTWPLRPAGSSHSWRPRSEGADQKAGERRSDGEDESTIRSAAVARSSSSRRRPAASSPAARRTGSRRDSSAAATPCASA